MLKECEQHNRLDLYINKCPLFEDLEHIIHNVEIKKSPSYTLCEIDTLYEFPTYNILIEEKSYDSKASRKKMNKQMKRYKRYNHYIEKKIGIEYRPTYYFYAYFNNDKLHLEYEGMKK